MADRALATLLQTEFARSCGNVLGARPGIQLTYTHHRYYGTPCPRCGLDNQASPKRAENDPEWNQVGLTEWRLVGPALASMIVYLSFDMRLTRRKLQRFLDELAQDNEVHRFED